MSKYAISPEGATAMQALAEGLLLAVSGIVEASSSLQQKCHSINEDLGVYAEEINDIIQSNVNSIKNHKDDITLLAQVAKQKADEIQSLFSLDSSLAGSSAPSSASTESAGYGSNSSAESIKSYSQSWAQQLSEGQKSAIYDYTRECPPMYRNINGVLRGKEDHFEDGNYERSELIHSALLKSSTPCDLTLYRGGGNSILGDLAFASDDELIGNFFQDKGYCSTSLSKSGAFFNDVLMVIHLPAGSHAASIESLSAAGSYEQEVLLDRGHSFSITNVYRDEHDRRVVEVFAVPDLTN